MNKIFIRLTVITLSSSLVACSSFNHLMQGPDAVQNAQVVQINPTTGHASAVSTPGESSGNVGGSIQQSMDNLDRNKMFRALDSAVGKSTEWTNAITNISYTVTPTKKVTGASGAICRQYSLTAKKDGQSRDMNGTACIGADGNWEST